MIGILYVFHGSQKNEKIRLQGHLFNNWKIDLIHVCIKQRHF